MSTGYNDRLKSGIWRGKVGDKEYQDDDTKIQQQCAEIAQLIREAQRVVAFTGAGICTSVGIPDFRGPTGVWTAEKKKQPPPQGVPFAEARPSLTHMALVALLAAGRLSHVVSQNVDGLHLKSGIPRDRVSELHGNIFLEVCQACGKEYLRDFDVEGMGLRPTGRFCDCGGPLHDRTYDWDTDLPDEEFTVGRAEHAAADVCLCLGTSLRIQPANRMPLLTLKKHKHKQGPGSLVLVNFQKTNFDKCATIRVFASVDQVMSLVMSDLGITIPTWSPGFRVDIAPEKLLVPALHLCTHNQNQGTQQHHHHTTTTTTTSTSTSTSTSTTHVNKRTLDTHVDADSHSNKRVKLEPSELASTSTETSTTATATTTTADSSSTVDCIRRSGRVTRSGRAVVPRIPARYQA